MDTAEMLRKPTKHLTGDIITDLIRIRDGISDEGFEPDSLDELALRGLTSLVDVLQAREASDSNVKPVTQQR